uniref:Major facilitator superfamily (MFS) profile domain-containing protein n=1 Tax=Zea mays TaxID=4577 RepID=A0A804NKL6_MAIZE
MVIGGVAFLAGAAVSGGAVNVYMAILGRALLGVGLGYANHVRVKNCHLLPHLIFFLPSMGERGEEEAEAAQGRTRSGCTGVAARGVATAAGEGRHRRGR